MTSAYITVLNEKPWLSQAHKEKRLQFAKEHTVWGLDEWRRCGFTDEMMIQTGGNSKKRYVRRMPREEYLEDCCGATVIPGFEKVKIWGAMRYGKLSSLVIISESQGEGKLTTI